MNLPEINTPPQPRDGVNIEKDEVKKASFWVSQLFVLTATVLGVFLAAQQGFRQAVLFENIQSDKSNYYLRKSLQNELNYNIELTYEFIEKVNQGHTNPELKLETFVWETMKYSNSTLETPPYLLGESQLFYRKANEIVNTSYYPRATKAKKLEELIQHMKTEVMPAFEVNTQKLADKLAVEGIEL